MHYHLIQSPDLLTGTLFSPYNLRGSWPKVYTSKSPSAWQSAGRKINWHLAGTSFPSLPSDPEQDIRGHQTPRCLNQQKRDMLTWVELDRIGNFHPRPSVALLDCHFLYTSSSASLYVIFLSAKGMFYVLLFISPISLVYEIILHHPLCTYTVIFLSYKVLLFHHFHSSMALYIVIFSAFK